MQQEFEKLNKMISALLNTQPTGILSSPIAIARALGYPYDPLRIALFEKLFIALMQQEFKPLPEKNIHNQSFKNFAFYEAYFSNYIEGTEFELEDAKAIIESNTPMPTRDEDSHDILGTYRIVSNLEEMSMVPKDANQLIEILLYRHKLMMGARVSKKPGIFMDVNNRAGETYFVDYTLVKGTLIRGFDYLKNLTDPFSKAAYMMFLISEVHPFLDGNGRIARIMMNAELVHQLQTKIIIPTVYRENYLAALRKLSRQQEPSAYIRMLKHAHEFSNNLIGETLKEMEIQLNRSNAFKDPENAKLLVVL
jgi:Fic family protein